MTDDIADRFPYECLTLHHYSIVMPWCEEQFGEFDKTWYRFGTDIAGFFTHDNYDYYRFACEEDAVLFRLKWS